MTAKIGGKTSFEKSRQYSADALWVKNVVEIALSGTVSEIHAFLCFTQKFKMAAKNDRKTIFEKGRQYTFLIPWGYKNFDEITLSHIVSKINVFLRVFTQKFKMAAKSGGKTIFSRQLTRTMWVKNFDEIALSCR